MFRNDRSRMPPRVIIEPESVKTAMYDKGEKEDLSEFKQTEYWEAVQNFQKGSAAEARRNGLSPERLGQAVHMALTTAKPKTRYAVVPQRSKNWTLPRLLPERMLDAQLALSEIRPDQETFLPNTCWLTSMDGIVGRLGSILRETTGAGLEVVPLTSNA